MTSWRPAIVSGALFAAAAFAAALASIPNMPRAATVSERNIDFYLLIDTSPSMSIPATSRGISLLEAATQPNEKGCAFACHERVPDDLEPFRTASGAPISCAASGAYSDGTTFTADSKFPYSGRDNYDLARCLGATLRIDLVRSAVQDLIRMLGPTRETSTDKYRMALFETNVEQGAIANDVSVFTADPMDQLDACGGRSKEFSVYKLQSLTSALGPAGPAFAAAGNISAMEVYDNNRQLSGHQNCNMDTNLDSEIASMNQLMPAAGTGASGPSDRAQEVLLIVTDAFNDPAPERAFGPIDWDGSRCSEIKHRGIRIAVLYTTYYAGLLATRRLLDEPDFSEWLPKLPTNLPPRLAPSTPLGTDPMALAAQQCASPGLYAEVGADGDISAAMQALFNQAVHPAAVSGDRSSSRSQNSGQ